MRAGINAGVERQSPKERPQSLQIEKTCVQARSHSLGDICLLTPAEEDSASFVSTDHQHSAAAAISPSNIATKECHCVSPSKRSNEPEASSKRSFCTELLYIPNVPCENRFKLLESIGDDTGNVVASAYHRGKKVWYFVLLGREETVAVIYDQWKNLKHPWQIRDPVRLYPQRFLYRGPRFRHRP